GGGGGGGGPPHSITSSESASSFGGILQRPQLARCHFLFLFQPSLDGEQPLPLRGRRLCFRAHTQFVEHLANETAVVGLDVFQRPVLEICFLDGALNFHRQCEPIIGRALGLGERSMCSGQTFGDVFHPLSLLPPLRVRR